VNNVSATQKDLFIPTATNQNELISKIETALTDPETNETTSGTIYFMGKELRQNIHQIKDLGIIPHSRILVLAGGSANFNS
jgi:hypothetical protein